MAKMETPTVRAARQGSAHVSLVGNRADPTTLTLHIQQTFAAVRLTRRFGLPPATAAAVAELAGMGVAQ